MMRVINFRMTCDLPEVTNLRSVIPWIGDNIEEFLVKILNLRTTDEYGQAPSSGPCC